MKNIEKLMATILIITFGLSFIGNIRTYSEDVFFGDGTETFVPGRSPSIIERRLQKLNSDPPFNIVDALAKTKFSEEKVTILNYFFQNFVIDQILKNGEFFPLVPSSFKINLSLIREALRFIIKATGILAEDPFGLDRLVNSIHEMSLVSDHYIIASLKIISDFIKSEELTEEVKEEIIKSCDLFKDEDFLQSINDFIGSI